MEDHGFGGSHELFFSIGRNGKERKKVIIKPRSETQKELMQSLSKDCKPYIIAEGPAGTGKTYLAVAYAAQELEFNERTGNGGFERIIICRPAVEAGERLGFLPGDLQQKVDPYMRPIYDALYEFFGYEKTSKFLEKGAIEVAPLAFMRGRTFNNAVIILDEAQNATPVQMKMFLTRLGNGSRAIVTGDGSQVDLPEGEASGLVELARMVSSYGGAHQNFSLHHFQKNEIVRSGAVRQLLDMYHHFEKKPG